MSETLYDDIGGKEAIQTVVDDFYDLVMEDDRVNVYFEDTDMERQRAHQAKFISSVAGGPVEYTGDDMREAHEGMGIGDREFDIIATHLKEAFEINDVDEEKIDAVMSEVESLRDPVLNR
ncbi:group 1 truncated hemoglobin [Halorutilales archaeon Cl-col2-1]